MSNPWDDESQLALPVDEHEDVTGTKMTDPLSPTYDDGRPRPPILANYMFKLKHKPSYIGSWTRRFWKINIRFETLEYYPTEEDANKGTDPSRSIPIKNIMAVRGIGDWFFQVIVLTDLHQQVVYNLKVDDREVKENWVRDLGAYFAELKLFEEEKYKSTPRTRPIPTLLEGHLYKLKHKPSSIGSWGKRYFRIDPLTNTFAYFSTAGAGHPKQSFALNDISGVRQADDWTFQVEIGEPMTQIFTLQAPSKEELTLWLTEIEKYLEERRAYDEWLIMSTHNAPPPPTSYGW